MVYTSLFPTRLLFVVVCLVSLPAHVGSDADDALRLELVPHPIVVGRSHLDSTRFSVNCQNESDVCIKREICGKKALCREKGRFMTINACQLLTLAVNNHLLGCDLCLCAL